MQVVDFPEAEGPKELCYDEEWLAVLRSTHHLMKTQPSQPHLPGTVPPICDIETSYTCPHLNVHMPPRWQGCILVLQTAIRMAVEFADKCLIDSSDNE